jgi:hypothetical protein
LAVAAAEVEVKAEAETEEAAKVETGKELSDW